MSMSPEPWPLPPWKRHSWEKRTVPSASLRAWTSTITGVPGLGPFPCCVCPCCLTSPILSLPRSVLALSKPKIQDRDDRYGSDRGDDGAGAEEVPGEGGGATAVLDRRIVLEWWPVRPVGIGVQIP